MARWLAISNFDNWEVVREKHIWGVEISVHKLVIPVYPKIRLFFGNIYSSFLESKRISEHTTQKTKEHFKSELLLLFFANKYKQYILGGNVKDKTNALLNPLARFLWVIRIYKNGSPLLDYVYDGTSFRDVPKVLEFQ